MKKLILVSIISLSIIFSGLFIVQAEASSEIRELENRMEKAIKLEQIITSYISTFEGQDNKRNNIKRLKELHELVNQVKKNTKNEIELRKTKKSEDGLKIHSVEITSDHNSARIEWRTNKPSESKIFFWEEESSDKKMVSSKTGLSLTHYVEISDLSPSVKKRSRYINEEDKEITTYNFEIEAIDNSGNEHSKIKDYFSTDPYVISGQDIRRVERGNNNCRLIDFRPTTDYKIEACRAYRELKDIEDPPFPAPKIRINPSRLVIQYESGFNLQWDVEYAERCTLDGSGIESSEVSVSGQKYIKDIKSSSTYLIECVGDGGSSSEEATIKIDPDSKPTSDNQYYFPWDR